MREGLKEKDIIQVFDLAGKEKTYHIKRVLGYGATCIVYDAFFKDDLGLPHYVKLKECFPIRGTKEQRDGQNVIWQDADAEKEKKDQFIFAYKQHVSLQSNYEFVNTTCKVSDVLYTGNNTHYYEMESDYGKSFDKNVPDNLYQILRNIQALVKTVGRYHDLGILHLDLKPQNFMVIPETDELVKLFDFDSLILKDSITQRNVEAVAYTNDWAAPEVKQGKINKISESADVYSIGMILFFAIFGRKMEITDKLSNGKFEYNDNPLIEEVNPAIKKMLDIFFAKTINARAEKRFSSMGDVSFFLQEMIVVADPNSCYLRSSLPANTVCFVGREIELEYMDKHFESGNKFIVLSGMGGIGKSELALKYARDNEEKYDVVVYAKVKKSLQSTIMEDDAFVVTNGKESEEFEDKIKLLKRVFTKRTLIILDDVKDLSEEVFHELLKADAKFIVTTRNISVDIMGRESVLKVTEMETDKLEALFMNYYQRIMDDEQRGEIRELIRKFDNYTFVIPLLAKQMRSASLLPGEMLKKIEEKGLMSIDKQKVVSVKDGVVINDLLYNHVKILFDLAELSQKAKDYLCALTLFGEIVVDKAVFAFWCSEGYNPKLEIEGRTDFDVDLSELNSLIEKGWIESNEKNNTIYLHDVLIDVFRRELKPCYQNCKVLLENYIKKLEYLIWDADGFGEMNIIIRNNLSLAFHFLDRLNFQDEKNARYVVRLVETIRDFYGGETLASSFLILNEDVVNKRCHLEIWLYLQEIVMASLVRRDMILLEPVHDMTEEELTRVTMLFEEALLIADEVEDWTIIKNYEGKEHYKWCLCVVMKKIFEKEVYMLTPRGENLCKKYLEVLQAIIIDFGKRRENILKYIEDVEALLEWIQENKEKIERQEKSKEEVEGNFLERLVEQIIENHDIPMGMKGRFIVELGQMKMALNENASTLLKPLDLNLYLPLQDKVEQYHYLKNIVFASEKEEMKYFVWELVRFSSTMKDLTCYFDFTEVIHEILALEEIENVNVPNDLNKLWFVSDRKNLIACLMLKDLGEIGYCDLSDMPMVWDELAMQCYLHEFYYLFLKIVNDYSPLVQNTVVNYARGVSIEEYPHLIQRLISLGEPVFALKILADTIKVLEQEKELEIERVAEWYLMALQVAKSLDEEQIYYWVLEKYQRRTKTRFGSEKKIHFSKNKKSAVNILNSYMGLILNMDSEEERIDILAKLQEETGLDSRTKEILEKSISHSPSLLEYYASGYRAPIVPTTSKTGLWEEDDEEELLIDEILRIGQKCFDVFVNSQETKAKESLEVYIKLIEKIGKAEENPFEFIALTLLPCAIKTLGEDELGNKLISEVIKIVDVHSLESSNKAVQMVIIPYIIKMLTLFGESSDLKMYRKMLEKL